MNSGGGGTLIRLSSVSFFTISLQNFSRESASLRREGLAVRRRSQRG